ncbi:unnamed protein product [Orchesella dallaii]|uniref:Uncharacterized protein n=1 Tax=Orchesella dallaii TaxID=48710 RepID=A0ABP1RP59_9HEXA
METVGITTWSAMQSMLVNHFGSSTVEFLWEENNPLSQSVFSTCIIFQCILLHFDFHIYENLKTKRQFLTNLNFTTILNLNFRVIATQKFSSAGILLVSDSTFTASSLKNRVLQADLEDDTNIYRKYPPIILSALLDYTLLSPRLKKYYVSLAVTASLLLFVRVGLDDVHLGRVPCLDSYRYTGHRTCWHRENGQLLRIQLEIVTKNAVLSFQDLIMFLEEHQSAIHFKTTEESQKQHCKSLQSYNFIPFIEDDRCDLYSIYFSFVNCSNFKECWNNAYYNLDIRLGTPSRFSYHVFPFVQNHIDFTFQVYFPKEYFLDGKLTAFLSPFKMLVWISCVLVFLGISSWLLFAENQLLQDVLIWQSSLILEQDGLGLRNTKFRGTMLIGLWMLSLFLIRQCYNSSLYSFMTTQKEAFTDFPVSMQEILLQNNFELISPPAFLLTLVDIGSEAKLDRSLVDLYLRIIQKSYFVMGHDNIEMLVLHEAIEQKPTEIQHFSPSLTYEDSAMLVKLLMNASRHFNVWSVQFSRFVIICEGGCFDGVEILGQNNMIRKIPKEKPILRHFKVWFQKRANFESVRFSKFLRHFAQSGLYDVVVNRFMKLQQLQILYNMDVSWRVGLSNGNLFSYVFLVNKVGSSYIDIKEEPTRMSVLVGTLVMVAFLLLMAFIIFIFEI